MNIKTALNELNLQETDRWDKIHRAYRQLVKRWHPDQFAHRPEIHSRAEERLKRINQAYAILNQHFNKSVLNREYVKPQHPEKATDNKTSKPFAHGVFDRMNDWIREAFTKGFAKSPDPENTGKFRKSSAYSSGVHQTGFETVFRKACAIISQGQPHNPFMKN